MKSDTLKLLSVDELWALHERVVVELASKIAAEKKALDERLRRLGVAREDRQAKPLKRPYPKVHPKYRNPQNAAETWAGRGKQPRWVRAQLRSGKKLEDLRIERA
jgi:DNA-binding protein H-NS